MKIDYCTLDKMRYNPKTGRWHQGYHSLEYREACATCGEPFLARTGEGSIICSRKCLVGELAPGFVDGRNSDPAHKASKHKAWHEKNRERALAQHKAWQEKNRERALAGKKAYREKNQELVRSAKKVYRETHPDVINASHAHRRALKKNLTPPEASPIMIQWLYGVAKLMEASTGEPWHCDHIHPLAEGGLHSERNIQVIPAKLNMSKGAKVGVDPTGITLEAINNLVVENGVSPYRRLQVPLARQIEV